MSYLEETSDARVEMVFVPVKETKNTVVFEPAEADADEYPARSPLGRIYIQKRWPGSKARRLVVLLTVEALS